MKKPLLLGIILTACVVIVAFVFSLGYPGGMISYWKFDEGSGLTASDSADANHGTFVSDPVWTSGQVGGALRFDGVDDYVDVSSVTCGGIGLTLEAWVKANDSSPNNWKGIVGGDSAAPQWQITLGQNRGSLTIWCEIQTSTGNHWLGWDTGSISTSDWTHIAMTYDGSSFTEYVNGVPGVSQPVSGTLVGWAPGWPNIGRGHYLGIGSDKYLFNGAIDEVAIYDRALTAEEIQQHYLNGLDGLGYEVECVAPPLDMVSWWPGDETTGATTEDIVDTYHGTLIGDATFASGKVGNALSFDGVGDYVSIGNMGDFPVQGTIDFWMKAEAVQNYRNPFTTNYNGVNAGIRFEEHSSHGGFTNSFYAVVGDDTSDYGGHVFRYTASEPPYNNPMQANTWYHVALVWDTTANNVKGYWDGVKAFDASHNAWPTEMQDVAIGNGYSTDRYWDGLVDEVEIFNRALTAEEIQAIYAAGSAGKCKVEPNQPPVADAGPNQMIECTNYPTGTLVTLDGSSSYDPEGSPLTYTWTGEFTEGGGTVTGVNPTVTLLSGTHTITLVVNDGQDDSEEDMVEISITLMIVEGFLPPLAELVLEGEVAPLPRKASKQGRTLPLKLQLFCGTTVLSDTDVDPPEIVSLKKIGNASGLETIDMDSGEANDSGLLFRFSEPIWVYNLSTRGMDTGTYVITIEMPDGRLFKGIFMLR